MKSDKYDLSKVVNEFKKEIRNKTIDEFLRKCEAESRVILDEITESSYYGLSIRELNKISKNMKGE